MNIKKHFDIVIVGAGLSGLTLAIALAELNLQIAIIDAKSSSLQNSNSLITSSKQEMRALALSYSSQQIFDDLGLWNDLQSHTTAIKHVHVSDRGNFGFTRIHASDYRLPCLGSVIAMQMLQQQLMIKIRKSQNISLLQPAVVTDTFIEQDKRQVAISIDNMSIILSCALVISADGAHSTLRELLELKTKTTDYQQTAIVANIDVARSHNNTAYERFTETGPLALLPTKTASFSLVWTVKPKTAVELSQLNDAEFLIQLQKAFGYRVGRFTWVGIRQAFPLSLVQAAKLVSSRAVIIGNAAHTLHPIAGQGFNLGLRDVAVLVDEIRQQCQLSLDIGANEVLKHYALRRKQDYAYTIGVTDNLVKLFSNDFLPLKLARNVALIGMDNTPLKHILAKGMMGIGRIGYSTNIETFKQREF